MSDQQGRELLEDIRAGVNPDLVMSKYQISRDAFGRLLAQLRKRKLIPTGEISVDPAKMTEAAPGSIDNRQAPPKLRVNGTALLKDIRAGVHEQALGTKFGLSPTQLQKIYALLIRSGRLGEEEFSAWRKKQSTSSVQKEPLVHDGSKLEMPPTIAAGFFELIKDHELLWLETVLLAVLAWKVSGLLFSSWAWFAVSVFLMFSGLFVSLIFTVAYFGVARQHFFARLMILAAFLLLVFALDLSRQANTDLDCRKTEDCRKNIHDIRAALRCLSERNDCLTRNLVLAATRGDVEKLQSLISEGASLDKPYNGLAPLIAACNNGRLEAVRILLEYGSDPNITYQGKTALTIARELEFAQIARLLQQRGGKELTRSICDDLREEATKLYDRLVPSDKDFDQIIAKANRKGCDQASVMAKSLKQRNATFSAKIQHFWMALTGRVSTPRMQQNVVVKDVETYTRLHDIIAQCANKLEHSVWAGEGSESQREAYYALLMAQMDMDIEKEIDMSSKRRKNIMNEINNTMVDHINALIRSKNKRTLESLERWKGNNYPSVTDENNKDQEKIYLKLLMFTQELVKPGGVKGTTDYEIIQWAKGAGLITEPTE